MSSNSHEELLVSYHKLQQTVGWIALLMPIVVRVLAFAYDKQQRNGVYVVCGGLMGLAFIWIGILWHLGKQSSIFWPETLAVMAFAAAWLVKGQLVLKDRHGPASHSRPSTQAGIA